LQGHYQEQREHQPARDARPQQTHGRLQLQMLQAVLHPAADPAADEHADRQDDERGQDFGPEPHCEVDERRLELPDKSRVGRSWERLARAGAASVAIAAPVAVLLAQA